MLIFGVFSNGWSISSTLDSRLYDGSDLFTSVITVSMAAAVPSSPIPSAASLSLSGYTRATSLDDLSTTTDSTTYGQLFRLASISSG